MIIKDIKFFKYIIPLKQPFVFKGHTVNDRSGFLVQVTTEDDLSGFGDIAPLPYFSSETFSRVESDLRNKIFSLVNSSIPNNLHGLNGQFEKWLKNYKLSSSARCGWEMSILNLLANKNQRLIAELLEDDVDTKVRLNGLLQGTKKKMVEKAKEYVSQGYKSIKVKVGTKTIQEDIEAVTAISSVIRGEAILRLDANQAWNLEEALQFGEAVDLTTIEYIEEPLSDISEAGAFYHETYIPIAIDESLQILKMEQIQSMEGIEFIIIKPTLLGGIEKSWQLAKHAERVGLKAIISSSFESSLGILILANLAACLSKHIAVGLDTFQWNQHDVLAENLEIKQGCLELSERALNTSAIAFNNLVEIKV